MLANQTFGMFNQAGANAGQMYGQGMNMLGRGMGMMGQAGRGFGMMGSGLGQGMSLYGQMGDQLGGAAGTYNRMARMRPADVQAGTLPGTNMAAYMNPFQQQVTDATMGEINRQQTLQDNQIQDQMQRAGAFGGDRMAVMQAENKRNFDQTRNQTLANLNLQNFSNAQSMATNDLNRSLTAQQGNQNMRAGMMQAGAAGLSGLASQGATGLANLGSTGMSGLASLGQGMAGLGQNQQQFGQNQLGNLSQQGFDMGQSLENRNMQMGNQQQQQMQSILDNIRQQTMGWQNYGDTGLARYFGATQNPGGYGTSSGTSTVKNQMGIGGILGSIAQLGALIPKGGA